MIGCQTTWNLPLGAFELAIYCNPIQTCRNAIRISLQVNSNNYTLPRSAPMARRVESQSDALFGSVQQNVHVLADGIRWALLLAMRKAIPLFDLGLQHAVTSGAGSYLSLSER
jgi:hypothetical protein